MQTLKGNYKVCDYKNPLLCSVLSIWWNLVGNYRKRQELGKYLFTVKINNKKNWLINLFKFDNEDVWRCLISLGKKI